jgi:hypothetical protein
MRQRPTPWALFAFAATAAVALSVSANETEPRLDDLVRQHLNERGTDVKLAPHYQLVRRVALDFVGVVPSPDEVAALEGASPEEIVDHFMTRGPLPHTGAELPYVWINLLKDADYFLWSNSAQFSQRAHILEFRDQLRRVYAEGWSYQEFTRWALQSQMFLNRFPSPADRANASFFLFLGRDSFSNEVPVGDVWNAWTLRDPNIPANQAETNPDYHVYDHRPERCDAQVPCSAILWTTPVSTPDELIEAMVSSPMFAEATVDRYWERLMGRPLPGIDFPDIRRALVRGFVASDYDVNWLVRELATSAAYTQEMMFR